tara:strand:+ start:5684 stop:6979 length:1296 start_codon:yes stop_codon:yes gene_type:complete
MRSEFIVQKKNLEKWAKDLFPLNRSLTGLGNRKTLNYIKKNINKNISIKSVRSNTKVFSWTIPQEWHVNYAKLLDKNKKVISDFKRNNLELLGYSTKIKKKIKYNELKNHLYFNKERPNAIPYVTSYYKKNWGFCIPFNKFKNLKKNDSYYVDISTKLFNGKMNYGEIFIKGQSKKEILICTYICHPSMANNELSGILVASLISTKIKKTKYSLRIIFIPETIGAIYYIKKNLKHLKKNLVAGFNLSCVGLPGKINIIKTIYENSYVDKVCERLSLRNKDIKLLSFLKRGSNERQFGCQNLYLPFVTICTKRFGDFKEYHTSDDNLDILNFNTIIKVTNFVKKIVKEINENDIYIKNSYCEPFLSGKKIIEPIASIKNQTLSERISMQNFLAYTNKSNDLKSLSKMLAISTKYLKEISNKLLKHKIIKKYI